MERVTGIGGVFFRAKDPAALQSWYETNLGINPVPTDFDMQPWVQEAGATVFAPFPEDTDYFGEGSVRHMINFRVASLDAMMAQLRASGIDVSESDPMPIGRFARLRDPEGNPIELWEPAN